jgi:1-acyl-sn-glycerol-3-phosphate acyltransferase
MKDWLHTAATGGAVLATGIFGPLAAGATLFNEHWADPVIRMWARNILDAAGTRVHVRGLERLPEGTCILVSNHQSNFDVVVLFACIPKHLRFVAKAELFRIPLFGSWLKRTGNIRVERKGGDKDRQTLAESVAAVRERVSVMFFPEGTRSTDGQLKPFKKGAALLALQAQVPIVPMGIAGTLEIAPPGQRMIRGGRHATLVVGEPISTVGRELGERDALTGQAREAVAKLMEEAQIWLQEVS